MPKLECNQRSNSSDSLLNFSVAIMLRIPSKFFTSSCMRTVGLLKRLSSRGRASDAVEKETFTRTKNILQAHLDVAS